MVRLVFDFPPFGRLGFRRPVRTLAAASPADVRGVLDAAEGEARAGRWAAGFVSYQAAPAFDDALAVRPGAAGPLAWFGVFDRPDRPAAAAGEARLSGLEPDTTRRQHAAAVAAVRRALARGDAYQVNLTLRMRGRLDGDPFSLYERLRSAQGGGLGACLRIGDRALVSASPELFFERRGDRVRVRPMKGTARRGRWGEEDAAAAAALAASPKERAENVMIVDLLRNDLGRVARTGTVRSTALFEVERYRTVLQMTSTVEARLPRRLPLASILGSLFPSGSVTGAPKVSAMRIIAALERSPRGPYCGAIGLVAPGGDAVFSVAIRTLDCDLSSGEVAYGTGGGITWASRPGAEWDEALAKAAVLDEPPSRFALVETMRLERGRYARLRRHLARLEGSARYFGFRHDPEAVAAALEREAAAAAGAGRRVRLLLAQDGSARAESAPLPPPPGGSLPVALAPTPVSRDDRFLFHKTTRREVYDARRRERGGVFDVLLANREGELTEFTIGNLVAEIGGERLTPPRACGLLGGVMREQLLARGEVRERVLRPSDLRRATGLWLANSVRGLVRVRLVPGD